MAGALQESHAHEKGRGYWNNLNVQVPTPERETSEALIAHPIFQTLILFLEVSYSNQLDLFQLHEEY